MDILSNIIKNKRIEISKAKKRRSLTSLRYRARPRDFKKAIAKRNKLCVIAEVKKASPSAGIIRSNFNPVQLALQLEKAGADALSVLTDRKFFKGHLSYISKIKAKVKLPILRKDFIIDEYQVYESRAFGADAILLIARILTQKRLKILYDLAEKLGMDCVVEVFSKSDLKKALAIKPRIIGINNRNLKTFRIDLKTTPRLMKLIPKGKLVVSESGIKRNSDISNLKKAGIDAVLIGEAFMNKKIISLALK
ncbi:MAG: indole-3-glycerol phosphate synthase TrpC [Candidatus Omnitrophota bacterium]